MRSMIPDISNNPTYLRYYEILRVNPSSIVFAPLAEILILHKCYQEAITVCKKGLEQNPELISGRIALARAYIGVGNYARAGEEAKYVLKNYPDHKEAVEILEIGRKHSDKKEIKSDYLPEIKPVQEEGELEESNLNPDEDNRWFTPTMAEIYAAQGNIEMARKIYNDILKREPGNIGAKEALNRLSIDN